MFFFPTYVWFPMQICFNSKDQQVRYGTKEYSDIGNSNQSETDLKNISEYCEHLSSDLALSIA